MMSRLPLAQRVDPLAHHIDEVLRGRGLEREVPRDLGVRGWTEELTV